MNFFRNYFLLQLFLFHRKSTNIIHIRDRAGVAPEHCTIYRAQKFVDKLCQKKI